jgi:hypothetical protein
MVVVVVVVVVVLVVAVMLVILVAMMIMMTMKITMFFMEEGRPFCLAWEPAGSRHVAVLARF